MTREEELREEDESRMRVRAQEGVAHPQVPRERYEQLLAALWLYVDWRFVTTQLTSDQKTLFADSVDAAVGANLAPDGQPQPVSDRWWEDDERSYHPYCCRTGWKGLPNPCVVHHAAPLFPLGTARC